MQDIRLNYFTDENDGCGFGGEPVIVVFSFLYISLQNGSIVYIKFIDKCMEKAKRCNNYLHFSSATICRFFSSSARQL